MEEHEAIVKNRSAALRAAFPATIPVMTGYLCLGAAFGILLRTAGYGIGWSIAMSMICYCGSMQFVGVSLLTAAFDPFQALLMSVMVNARHAFYGLSMLEKYRGTGPVRPVLICTLTDETFSLVSTLEPPEGVARRDFYFWISLLDYLYWQVGCTLGNAVGGLLPPVLYCLPHPGRGTPGGRRPAQAGGRYPHRAEKRSGPHRRGCPREDVRTFEVTQASLRKCADSR